MELWKEGKGWKICRDVVSEQWWCGWLWLKRKACPTRVEIV